MFIDFGTLIDYNKGHKNMNINTAEKHKINFEVIRKVFGEIVKAKKIKALFAFSDMLASAIYPLMLMKGIIPGKDMELVSCNKDKKVIGNRRDTDD